MSCVLLVDVTGTLMLDQFEIIQFQRHFNGVVLDILNCFEKLTMVMKYEVLSGKWIFTQESQGFKSFWVGFR